MTTTEALYKLTAFKSSIVYSTNLFYSQVDETKTLTQRLEYWEELFSSKPYKRIGSIIRYNVNRDFNCL